MSLKNGRRIPPADRQNQTINSSPCSHDVRPRTNTQGIILSGAHSWERSGFCGLICKTLVPIALQPLIWHVTQWLRRGGIERAHICGNGHTDYLREQLKNGFANELALSYVEDIMPRGPAGCVRDAGIGQRADQFVVIEGTVVPHVDLPELLDAHKKSRASLTVVSGDDGRAGPSDVTQKPMGIYVFSSRILREIPRVGYQDIKETLIPALHRMGERVVAFKVARGVALRVGNAASYLRANMTEVQRIAHHGTLGREYVKIAQAWVHTSTQVDPTARFIGPALVDAGCTIGPGSLVVGPTSIGAGCRIEPFAVVSRAVVWDRCTIGRSAMLDHSILTSEANVLAGEVLRYSTRFGQHRSRHSTLGRLIRCFRIARKGEGIRPSGQQRNPRPDALADRPVAIGSQWSNRTADPHP